MSLSHENTFFHSRIRAELSNGLAARRRRAAHTRGGTRGRGLAHARTLDGGLVLVGTLRRRVGFNDGRFTVLEKGPTFLCRRPAEW